MLLSYQAVLWPDTVLEAALLLQPPGVLLRIRLTHHTHPHHRRPRSTSRTTAAAAAKEGVSVRLTCRSGCVGTHLRASTSWWVMTVKGAGRSPFSSRQNSPCPIWFLCLVTPQHRDSSDQPSPALSPMKWQQQVRLSPPPPPPHLVGIEGYENLPDVVQVREDEVVDPLRIEVCSLDRQRAPGVEVDLRVDDQDGRARLAG